MAASLAGRGAVKCSPYLQRPHSSDGFPHHDIYQCRSFSKRIRLNPTATVKGGDVTKIPIENNHHDSDSEYLARHAIPVRTSNIGARQGKGRRLGEKELGPYHAELRMPAALFQRLATQEVRQTQHMNANTGQLYRVSTPCNELRDVMPSLAYLLHCVSVGVEDISRTIKTATLCHPCVRHVFKVPNEGGFCGYRNAQTLCSFIAGTDWRASRTQVLTREARWRAEEDLDILPSVIELQHMIEAAWNEGINPHCRDETGGLIGRRVYIGTPEVQSLLLSLGIPAATYSIAGEPDLPACDALVEAVLRHFRLYEASDAAGLVEEDLAFGGILKKTAAPPIFLQQPGHSLTIVGYEVHGDGSISLIILDPGYTASPAMRKIAGRFASPLTSGEPRYDIDNGWEDFAFWHGISAACMRNEEVRPAKGFGADVLPADAGKLLKVHRRNREKLSRYKEFEIVVLE